MEKKYRKRICLCIGLFSEELRMAIENLISGSFNGILRDNISIDIEYTEKE